ncbi:MAG: hypothetical protein WCD89_10860 [Anaerocolumna sp.]
MNAPSICEIPPGEGDLLLHLTVIGANAISISEATGGVGIIVAANAASIH